MHEFLIVGIVRDDWLDLGRWGEIRMLRPFQIILEVLLEKARVNLEVHCLVQHLRRRLILGVGVLRVSRLLHHHGAL
jgi:hypothetical protein